MTHTLPRFLVRASLLLTGLSPAFAQTTWILDGAAGPGHDFTTFQAALATATTGDTILVRAGAYTETAVSTDQGISIVGLGGVSLAFNSLGAGGITVHDLPNNAAFAVRNMRLGSTFGAALRAVNCQGLVLVDDVEGTLGSFGVQEGLGFSIENCQQVHLHSVFVRGGWQVHFVDSKGVITYSALEGYIGASLSMDNSAVLLDHCTISAEPSLFQLSGPVKTDGGRLSVTRSTIQAIVGPFQYPAIVASNGTVIQIDPTAAITAPTGPAISGSFVQEDAELVSLSQVSTDGSTTLDLQGRSGAVFATVTSFPSSVTQLPWGDVWVNLDFRKQLVLDVGVLSQRRHVLTLPTAGLPAGLALVMQSAILDGNLTISNAVGLIVK